MRVNMMHMGVQLTDCINDLQPEDIWLNLDQVSFEPFNSHSLL